MNRPVFIPRERPSSVQAIELNDPESAQRIADWVDETLHRSGAVTIKSNGIALPSAWEEGPRRHVPFGWVVYKFVRSSRFRFAPQDLFYEMYEERP